MLENELHPMGAIAFAEARGQKVVEEIVLKKFEKVNEVLEKHKTTKGKLIFDPGTCSI